MPWGAALGILIAIFEITEIPVKLLAVGIGAPEVLLVYEIVQPAVTLPAAVILIQKISKNVKLRKRLNDKSDFKLYRKSKKEAKHLIGKDKNLLINIHDELYTITTSSVVKDFIQALGFKRDELNFKNLKKLLKVSNINSEHIQVILKQKSIPKQIRVKLAISHIDKELLKKHINTDHKLKKINTPSSVLKWSYDVMSCKVKKSAMQII